MRAMPWVLAAASLVCSLAVASQAAEIIHLVPEDQAGQLPRFKAVFLGALKERGVAPEIIAGTRFVTVGQGAAAAQEAVAGTQRTGTRVVVVPTFLMLKALLPVADRPPIVFHAHVNDLVQRLPALAAPGVARATGVNAWGNVEVKMLELLTLARADLRRVCALTSATDVEEGTHAPLLRHGRSAGIEVTQFAVDSLTTLSALVAAKRLERCDALILFVHKPLMDAPRAYIERVNALGIPAVYAKASLGQYGALVTVEPDVGTLLQHSFDQVVAILRGARLDTLPIAEPYSFVIGVNVATARALRPPLDKRLLLRATEFHGE